VDKEKKIAEIREALEKIDRGDLSEIGDAHGKAGEWLRFLLDELDRLQAERDSHGPEGRNYTNKQYVDLLAERDKLIEGLRWYADSRNWAGDVFAPPEVDDGGQRARDILKEIGVTVE